MRRSDNYLLGFKAIVWNIGAVQSESDAYVSPQRIEFKWPRDGYVEANCALWGHTPPHERCGCGVYATTSLSIMSSYLENTLAIGVIVAACGETEIWSGGFRSQAAQVIAVVGGWRSSVRGSLGVFDDSIYIVRDTMATMAAAEFFNVDVVDVNVALHMIRSSWEDEGYREAGGGEYYKAAEMRLQETGEGVFRS